MSDKKILLVDDDPKVTAVSSYLEKLGFKMLNATDGKKALEVLKSDRPNLVILDMEMPGIDGLQILKILKAEYKDIKVFVFTAHGAEYRKKAEKIGYDLFFDKSDYELNELLDAIRDVFGMEKVIERKKAAPLEKTPKARLLFIEPSIEMYSFTSGLFDNTVFCTGEYERRAIYYDIDNLSVIILNELMNYQPDIVLINDYAMTEGEILNMIELIRSVKIQPDEIIIHGLFERGSIFEVQLKIKGVKHCIQSPMAHQQLIEMNKKLIDFVNNECIEHGLVKE